MNKKGLSGWTWFWIILFLLIITGGGYSWYSSSGYDSYEEEEPFAYCYEIYYSRCDCSYNAYNCAEFMNQKDAQECFNFCRCRGFGYMYHLDEDNDGLACEWNN